MDGDRACLLWRSLCLNGAEGPAATTATSPSTSPLPSTTSGLADDDVSVDTRGVVVDVVSDSAVPLSNAQPLLVTYDTAVLGFSLVLLLVETIVPSVESVALLAVALIKTVTMTVGVTGVTSVPDVEESVDVNSVTLEAAVVTSMVVTIVVVVSSADVVLLAGNSVPVALIGMRTMTVVLATGSVELTAEAVVCQGRVVLSVSPIVVGSCGGSSVALTGRTTIEVSVVLLPEAGAISLLLVCKSGWIVVLSLVKVDVEVSVVAVWS